MGKTASILQGLFASLKNEYYSGRVRAVHALAFLTYRCTCRCKTCNIWKRGRDDSAGELSPTQWRGILSGLKDYGLKTLEIFGGDALLRKDLIYEIIEFCSRNGIKTFMPTNSVLLDGDAAKSLVEAGLDTIYFSLDDVGQVHDRIRGRNRTFLLVKRAIEKVGQARKNGKPRIIICTTLSSMNSNHFADIMDSIKEMPIDAVYPRIVEEFDEVNINNSEIEGIKPEPYFTSTDGSSHLLNDPDVDTLRNTIRKLKSPKDQKAIYLNSRSIDMAHDDTLTKGIRPIRRCLVSTTLSTIDPFGNVVPCPMYNRYSLGNLLKDKMEDIWGNEKHRAFIDGQRQKKIQICKNCSLNEHYPSLSDTLNYYSRRINDLRSDN